MNIDIESSVIQRPEVETQKLSLLDEKRIKEVLGSFGPDLIIHLAARTLPSSNKLSDYSVNFDGTKNLISAIRATTSVKRAVFVSTQHVISPGSHHSFNRFDLNPYGVYGTSKARMEAIIQEQADFPYVILRPTNVWGIGNKVLENGIWRLLKKGRYLHCEKANVMRNYGYVENVAWQICKFAFLDTPNHESDIFYVGDENMNQYDWLNVFSVALHSKPLRVIPNPIIKGSAMFGEFARKMGIEFPLDLERFHNLTTENQVPIEKTFTAIGRGPITFEVAVQRTVDYLKSNPEYKALN